VNGKAVSVEAKYPIKQFQKYTKIYTTLMGYYALCLFKNVPLLFVLSMWVVYTSFIYPHPLYQQQ
jgi:hypothetical protein